MSDRKRDIVRQLLPLVQEQIRPTEDHAMITWWTNIRSNGGLRLTKHGYEMMRDVLGIESWELDLSHAERHVFTKKMILEMDRKLEWPYFIDVNSQKNRRRVVFFSSREAMMANLYGDLKKWLTSL